MNIIQLIDRQNDLIDKLAEIERNESLSDVEFKKQLAVLKKDINDVEKSIQAAAKEIVDDPNLAFSDESEAFADALNEAAENGGSIEDVIFGEDSFVDPATANCAFVLMRVNGELQVMGGELTAQSRKYPWLIIRITRNGVDGYPIWTLSDKDFERPVLSQGVGCEYHTGGAFQRSTLAFFKRAYARQRKGDC